MPATTEMRISDLNTASILDESDLLEISKVNGTSASGYMSYKTTLFAIALYVTKLANYTSDLQTTNKTVIGAINELKQLISLIPRFSIEVVETLPTEDISVSTLYLVPSSDPETGNYYEEYIYVDDAWEMVGTTAVDLSDYYTKTQVDTLLNNKVDKVSGKGLSTNDFINNARYPDLTAGKSLSLVTKTYGVEANDSAPYVYRQFPASVINSKLEKLKKLIGASVVWNQIVDTNTTSVTITSGHKYIHWNGSTLTKATSDGTAISVTGGTDKIYDLTAMFGNDTVATAITTAKFAELFPDYTSYAYSANTIQSVSVSGHKIVGFNQFDKSTSSDWKQWYLVGATNKVVALDSGMSAIIRCLPNTTYYAFHSKGSRLALGSFPDYPQIGDTSSNNVVVSAVSGGNVTYTTGVNDRYLMIWFYNSNADTGLSAQDVADTLVVNISSSENGQYKPYTEETTTLDHTTLRGLFKLDANNNLYADGDIYQNDGNESVNFVELQLNGSENWEKRTGDQYPYFAYKIGANGYVFSDNCICDKYEAVIIRGGNNNIGIDVFNSNAYDGAFITVRPSDYSTLSVEDFQTRLSNNPIKIVFKIATPTTATLTPFNPLSTIEQGGTEEFVDYGVEQSTRDVAIPAGTDTDFYEEVETVMPLPNVPFEDGTYMLTAEVEDNEPVFKFARITT